MKLIIISAVSTDGVIGIGEDIPWRIPEDFKHYRDTTMGSMLLVGATTFKSLPKKAHEGREFIILNSGERFDLEERGYYQFSKLDVVLGLLQHPNVMLDNVYVIGGASIYDALIDYCDEAVITWVNKTYPDGDKRFPIDKLIANFEVNSDQYWQTSKSGLQYRVTRYNRKYDSPKKTEN
jgi:dihydrofolate reductase